MSNDDENPGTADAALDAVESAGGLIGGEAGAAIEQGAGAARSIGAAGSGDAARGAGSLASGASSATDAARYIVPDRDAQQVLSGGGSALRGVGDAADALGGIGGGLNDVEFTLEVAGADGRWGVTSVSLTEELNTVPTCTVTALHDAPVEVSELLHKECALTMDRADQQRHFRGIIWHAQVDQELEDFVVTLSVAPAAAYLNARTDFKIYQDKTVVQVIKEAYETVLGGLQRKVNDENLHETYETREYVVQYRETSLAFITRLAEEEGLFWYFDHEEEKEVLVLADSVNNLPQARPQAKGEVHYHGDPGQLPDGEAVTHIRHDQRVGATDSVITDYDWTNPPVDVRGKQTGRSSQEPALEIFEHASAVVFHGYDGTQYGGNTAERQARLRAARLDLGRQEWRMQSTVVSAQPGHTLAVTGAPDGSLDQRYLIVAAHGHGRANGARGSWTNTLDVVPVSMPYCPPRRIAKPIAYGPEEAVIVGPDEIHTDEHGRVKVHFFWDRHHARDADDSSCWLRVQQNWAGPGFGTFYLPRVGMEVVVSFFGGDPDRPLVTGCLYNGANHANVDLPAKKTQTLIRTKSSVRSDGFNEIRFEDEAGNEFIYVHAQKDLNEVVENNHSTHVKANQTNTVDGNQTETVGGNQTMTVKKDRKKTIEQDERTHVLGNRTEEVDGDEKITIHGERKTEIDGNDGLIVHGDRETHVDGKDKKEVVGGREVTIADHDNLQVIGGANRNVHVTGQHNITVDGHFKVVEGGTETLYLNSGNTYLECSGRVQIKSDGAHLDMKPGGHVKLTCTTFEVATPGAGLKLADGKLEATADTEAKVAGSASVVKLEGSGATVSGPKVTSSASGMNEITGILVKIN